MNTENLEPQENNTAPEEGAAPLQGQDSSPLPEIPAAEADMKGREEALQAREAALAEKERRFAAREHLLAMGLPDSILAHVDCGSDQAVEAALTIAALSARAASQVPALPVPATSKPPAPAFASYVDRARLFREDPEAYKLMQVNNTGCPATQ